MIINLKRVRERKRVGNNNKEEGTSVKRPAGRGSPGRRASESRKWGEEEEGEGACLWSPVEGGEREPGVRRLQEEVLGDGLEEEEEVWMLKGSKGIVPGQWLTGDQKLWGRVTRFDGG